MHILTTFSFTLPQLEQCADDIREWAFHGVDLPLSIAVAATLCALLSLVGHLVYWWRRRGQKALIDELQHEERMYDLIFSSANDTLWRSDGETVHFSQKYADGHHMASNQISIDTFYRMVHPDSHDSLAILHNFRQQRGKKALRLKITFDGGATWSWHEIIYTANRISSETGILYGLMLNIDRSKEMEDLLTQAQMKASEVALKENFLANISHDLRTPLSAITGFSNLLVNPDIEIGPEERKEYGDIIHQNTEMILNMIDSVMKKALFETGELELIRSNVSVGKLVRKAYMTNRIIAPIHLQFILEEGEDCTVNIDPTRTLQVINNLVGNAFKFTAEGSVALGWRTCSGGEAVEVYVRDTGIGVAPESQAKLFDRYHKENESDRGTGLGLNISKTIIEKQGGVIGMESREGKGSRFYFHLARVAQCLLLALTMGIALSSCTGMGTKAKEPVARRVMMESSDRDVVAHVIDSLNHIGWRTELVLNEGDGTTPRYVVIGAPLRPKSQFTGWVEKGLLATFWITVAVLWICLIITRWEHDDVVLLERVQRNAYIRNMAMHGADMRMIRGEEELAKVIGRIHPEHSGDVERMKQDMEAEGRHEYEIFADERDDGTYEWWQLRFVVFYTKKRHKHIDGLLINIDSQKRHEAELRTAMTLAEEAKRKEDFLMTISHEIRTPLNAVVGFSDVIISLPEENLTEEEKVEFAHYISENNWKLEAMIEDILMFSRIESGRLKYVMREFNAADLISELYDDWKGKVPEGIELFAPNFRTHIYINGDRARVKYIINQLISNAIKFTKRGTIVLTPVYHYADQEVEFLVEDTGCGIAPEKQKAVFNLFWKDNEFVPGLGLGLNVANHLAEGMEARMKVDSMEGFGSQFSLIMKAELRAAEHNGKNSSV